MRNVSEIFRNFVILYKIQQGLLLSFMFYSNVHTSTSVLSSLPLPAGCCFTSTPKPSLLAAIQN